MSEAVPDYSDYKEPPKAGSNSMASLKALARKQKLAEQEVARLEDELAKAKESLKEVSERELPTLMADLQLGSFTTDDGIEISINESIHTSIPKGSEDEALTWLEKHDQSGLIKRSFVIMFNREEEAWANKFKADLAKRKKPVNAKITRKVEPQTLKAYVSKELEKGTDIPQKLFGVFRRKVSEVKIKAS